ncbi:hypothetical protein AKUH4B102A_02380 [Apilactobacillus kunkeei]|nr:hypothetical protein AKUH4B102A_02380 [Apilactobacillus kunkeei]
MGNFPNVTEFIGLDKVDTSNVIKMDNLFAQDKSVEQVDISGWNTSKVTTMSSLFDGLKSASEINVSGIDTKNVTSMFAMFAHGYKLENVIGANDLDFSNVTNMAYWFGYDPVIKSLDLSKVNAPNLQNANYMFINDASLRYVNLANFNSTNLIPEDNGLTQMFFFQNEEHGDIGDNEFSSSTAPNLQSVLTTFITGSNFNTAGIRFESFGGNRGVFSTQNGEMYYSNSRPFTVVDGHLSYESDDSKSDNSANNTEQNIYTSTVLWNAVQFRYFDGYTNQQIGNDYIYQGYANSTGVIPIPDGYGVVNGNNLSFKMPTRAQIKPNDFMNVTIYKKLNPVVNIVDNGSIITSKKYSVLQGETLDASDLIPSDYTPAKDTKIVVTQDATPINIDVVKKSDSNSSAGSNAENGSSSATSAESSSAQSSSATSAEQSSAQSSSATSAEQSSAQSSSATSAEQSSTQSSSATSAEQSSTQSSSVISAEQSSTQSSSVTSTESSSAQSSSVTSSESSSAQSSSVTSSEPSSAQSSSVTSSEPSSAQSSSATSSESSSAQSSSSTSSKSSSASSSKTAKHAKKTNNHGNNGSKPYGQKYTSHRVYMIKGFYRYSSTKFIKKNRLQGYKKHGRPNAVMFTIVGEAKSKNGLKRYKVYQIVSKKAGLFRVDRKKWGYITAKSSYMKSLYYSKNVHKVKVIGKGLRVYKNSKLSKYVKSYKRGTVLKVKAVKKLGTTYRLQLSNGKYVSSNKNLVKIVK